MAKELVKDYWVTIYKEGDVVDVHYITGNYQRLNVLNLKEDVWADLVEIRVLATNGDPDARIFEVRIY